MHTSTWFKLLSHDDRKTVLILLHGLRRDCEDGNQGTLRRRPNNADLINELTRQLDADHVDAKR